MFNVLPQELQDIIYREYRKRWFVVLLVMAIVVCIISIAFLIPSYMYIYTKRISIESESTNQKSSQVSKDINSMIKNVEETNAFVNTLYAHIGYNDPSEVLGLVIKNKTPGITLSELSFSQKSATSSVVTVEGVASKRDTLVSFARSIESIPSFGKITIPVSSFAKETDIKFSFDVTVSKQNE